MAKTSTCDRCGKKLTPDGGDNPIVLKLFLAPVLPGKTRSTHSHYSAHMDIGKCCAAPTTAFGTWQKRQTRRAYNNGRRLRPAPDSVQASAVREKGSQKRAGGGKGSRGTAAAS